MATVPVQHGTSPCHLWFLDLDRIPAIFEATFATAGEKFYSLDSPFIGFMWIIYSRGVDLWLNTCYPKMEGACEGNNKGLQILWL